MSSKTPVSTLHEMFMVKGITPYYDLTVNGAGTHHPFFKYRVICGDVESEGTGKSKKEAKHDAAQNLLNQLKNNGQSSNINNGLLEKMDVDEAKTPVASPYQDDLKHNVVGTLTTLCASNRISEPVYELIGEEGPPHCKIFTIQCSVLHLKEVAQARTKKQAKHKSSKQMLDKLLKDFNNCLDLAALEDTIDSRPPKRSRPIESSDDREEIEEVITKYLLMQKNKPVVQTAGMDICNYHTVSPDNNNFLLHPNFEHLKSIDIEEIPNPYSYVMETLFEALEVELDWYNLPSLQNHVHIKSVTVHSNPKWCFIGSGETEDEALRSCAIDMLRFFQKMLS